MGLSVARKVRFHSIIVGVCCVMAYVGYNRGWDPLDVKYGKFTGYAWSHFLMYSMMGFTNFFSGSRNEALCKAFALSVAWEATELGIGLSTGSVEQWTSGGWKGQTQDIVMNMMGYLVGSSIAKFYPCGLKNCGEKSVVAYEMVSILLVVIVLIRHFSKKKQ